MTKTNTKNLEKAIPTPLTSSPDGQSFNGETHTEDYYCEEVAKSLQSNKYTTIVVDIVPKEQTAEESLTKRHPSNSQQLMNTLRNNRPSEDVNLAKVAQEVETDKGLGTLKTEVQEFYELHSSYTRLHEFCSSLPKLLNKTCSDLIVLTTDYSNVLTKAFEDAGKDFNLIYLSFEENNHIEKLYHVCFKKSGPKGVLEKSTPRLLDEDEYLKLTTGPTLINIYGLVDVSQNTVSEKKIELTGEKYDKLVQALMKAFPKIDDLDMMLRLSKLEKNINVISSGKNLKTTCFELIKKAEAEGWVEDLILAAKESNSGNLYLQDFSLAGSNLKSSNDKSKRLFTVTEDNQIDYLVKLNDLFPKTLQNNLLLSNFIFIGVNFKDWTVRNFFRLLFNKKYHDKISWVVSESINKTEERLWCESFRPVDFIPLSIDSFINKLRPIIERLKD